MSITNYTELQAAVANWLETDQLTARIPEFIALHEAVMNFGLEDREHGIDIPPLRSNRAETRGALTILSEYTTLPTDYLAGKSLRLTSTSPVAPLDFFQEEEFNRRLGASIGSAQPKMYTITGTSVRVAPTPDQSYTGELVYNATIPALSGVATNWVLTYHPNVYLNGTLLQSALFMEDDAAIARWLPATISSMRGVNRATDKFRFPGPLRARSAYTVS